MFMEHWAIKNRTAEVGTGSCDRLWAGALQCKQMPHVEVQVLIWCLIIPEILQVLLCHHTRHTQDNTRHNEPLTVVRNRHKLPCVCWWLTHLVHDKSGQSFTHFTDLLITSVQCIVQILLWWCKHSLATVAHAARNLQRDVLIFTQAGRLL